MMHKEGNYFNILKNLSVMVYTMSNSIRKGKIMKNFIHLKTKVTSVILSAVICFGMLAAGVVAHVDAASNGQAEDKKIYISDLDWKSAENGAGLEIGIDKSVNGNKLKVRDLTGAEVEYDKGLGMHAVEENDKYAYVTYDIAGKGYTRFKAFAAADLEAWGSITFEVLVDGVQKYYNEAPNSWNNEGNCVDVDITGASEITLRVGNGGNGNGGDHADWCDAYFVQPAGYIEPDDSGDKTNPDDSGKTIDADAKFLYLSDMDWKSASSGWQTVQKDKNISGGAITLADGTGSPVVYKKGLGTHAESTIIYDISQLSAKEFLAYVGADAGEGGTVSFEVYVDDVKKFDSGLMEQQNEAKKVAVNVEGAKILKLVVTNGNGNNACDHASWADAKLLLTSEENVEKPKYTSTWLSDIQWKSATSGWQTVQRDKEVNGNPIVLANGEGSTTTYEKGLGVHAHSEIIYDIAGKGYITFESYVGADFGEGGTVKFQVWVDGVKKYESPSLMEQQNAAEFISVDIKDAKELKLVVTEGNGSNACDHASWANAKLIGLANGSSGGDTISPKTGENTVWFNFVLLCFAVSAASVVVLRKKVISK